MTAPGQMLDSLLRRAWLLAGVLAVIAGIFGMHVMTPSHASHAGAAHVPAAHAAVVHSGAVHSEVVHAGGNEHGAPHPTTTHSGTAHSSTTQSSTAHASGLGHPAAGAVVVLSAGAVCADACPGAEEAGASCVPSASAGSFTVVARPAPAIQPGPAGAAVTAAGYSYVPSSPTPCELSISRT